MNMFEDIYFDTMSNNISMNNNSNLFAPYEAYMKVIYLRIYIANIKIINHLN